MREKILCPVCLKRKLALRQINVDCAVYLCRDKKCIYPLGHSWRFESRTLEEMYRDKKKRVKKKPAKTINNTTPKLIQEEKLDINDLLEREIDKIRNTIDNPDSFDFNINFLEGDNFESLFKNKDSEQFEYNNTESFNSSSLLNNSYIENILANDSTISNAEVYKDVIGFYDNLNSSNLSELLNLEEKETSDLNLETIVNQNNHGNDVKGGSSLKDIEENMFTILDFELLSNDTAVNKSELEKEENSPNIIAENIYTIRDTELLSNNAEVNESKSILDKNVIQNNPEIGESSNKTGEIECTFSEDAVEIRKKSENCAENDNSSSKIITENVDTIKINGDKMREAIGKLIDNSQKKDFHKSQSKSVKPIILNHYILNKPYSF